MNHQKTQTTKNPNPTNKPTTKSINVTKLTHSQRQKIFVDCMSQSSFAGFVKDERNNQTFYIFRYQT